LTHSGDSHATGFGLDPTLSVKHFLEPASLVYAGLRDTSDSEISPLFAEIPSGFPPTLISTATRDLLLSDSVRLAQKLRAKNCPVDFRVTEGLWHVFEWYPPCPEAVASLLEISKFLTNFFR
jgi:acetyl esterase/lipase